MSSSAYASPADLAALVPAFIIALTGLVAIVVDLLARGGALRRVLAVAIGIVGLVAAGVAAAQQYGLSYAAFGGAYLVGGFATAFTEIAIFCTIVSLALTLGVGRDDQIAGSTALMLWSTCGVVLMAGAGNLMTVFLGIELLSLGLYCLCAMSTRAGARESGLKYLLLSSMASGFLLYGMALLFGATGSVALSAIATAAPSVLLTFGAGLFLVGLAFKLSLVPFHAWTPDVYEGAPLAVTAYMSIATKAGILAVLGRFAYAALSPATANAIMLPMWTVAAISMIAGNVAALAQRDMKRLLAYSGIAQVGYIVAAFAGQTPLGLRYALFYFDAYTFMNLGAFAVTALMMRDGDGSVGVANFAGLAYRRPWLAAAMTFFLLALAGLPPTAGFTGKVLILASSVGAGYWWLAVLLIAGTAISAYVYFKIVRAMYVRVDPAHVRDERSRNPLPWISIAVCAAATFALGLYPLAPSNVLPLVK